MDGNFLVAGGIQKKGLFYDTAEVFSPGANSFSTVAHKMVKKRVSYPAARLEDGRVFIPGGYEFIPSGEPTSTDQAWIFRD